LRAYAGWAVLIGFSCVAAWFSLYPPQASVYPPLAPALARTATSAEIKQTKSSLNTLRVALSEARSRFEAAGAARFPTLLELQENRLLYADDSSAPLIPSAHRLPENPLTDGHGAVIQNCDEPMSQSQLRGDNADWHYCPDTGRLLPSAGVSGLLTKDW